MKPYFKNLTEFGNLYIDYDIIYYDCSILFTCVDDNKNLFLCMCTDILIEQKWILVPTTKHIIINLLQNKTSVLESLKQSRNKHYIITFNIINKKESITEIEFSNINPTDLPADDFYIEPENGEFDEYINTLK